MKSLYQERAMHELCEITSSKRIFAADYQTEGVPFFSGKEITERFNGATSVSTELFISRQKFEEIKAKFGVPKVGDLLLTSVGTLGSTYVVQPGDEFYFKDGNITWFRNFKGLNSTYLHYWLSSPAGKAEQKKCTIGSSQSAYTIVLLKEMKIGLPPLSPDRITEYRFALPPSDVTEQFARLISPMMHQSDVLLEKNEVLRTTRDLLLPKLISGELDVSENSAHEEMISA